MLEYKSGVRSDSERYFVHAEKNKNSFFYPICMGEYICSQEYHVYRQRYDSFLLIYIKEGLLKVLVEDGRGEINVHQGECILIDCYQWHQYQAQGMVSFLWIHIDGKNIREYYDMGKTLNGNAVPAVLKFSDTQKMKDDFYLLLGAAKGKYCSQARMSATIADMLAMWLDALDKKEQNMEYENINVLAPSLYNIHEKYQKDWTVQELADLSHLSLGHFIKRFEKETGKTPHRYLTETRIKAAAYFLKSTPLTVKEIAYECGFSSENSFCMAFRRIMNISPGLYRKQ